MEKKNGSKKKKQETQKMFNMFRIALHFRLVNHIGQQLVQKDLKQLSHILVDLSRKIDAYAAAFDFLRSHEVQTVGSIVFLHQFQENFSVCPVLKTLADSLNIFWF